MKRLYTHFKASIAAFFLAAVMLVGGGSAVMASDSILMDSVTTVQAEAVTAKEVKQISSVSDVRLAVNDLDFRTLNFATLLDKEFVSVTVTESVECGSGCHEVGEHTVMGYRTSMLS